MSFCKEPIPRYHFNVLRMINTLYHIYIESGLFHFKYVDQIKFTVNNDF